MYQEISAFLVPYSNKRCIFAEGKHAIVAQLVEHWLPKPRVAGSSPVYRSRPAMNTNLHPHTTFSPQHSKAIQKKSITFAVGFADMAQLVEQRIRNAWVGGSSPPIGSRQEKRGTFLSFFVYHAEHCKNLARKSIQGYLAMYPRINRKVSNDTLQSNLASFFRPFHLCFIFVYRQCLCCIILSSVAEEIGEDELFGMSGQCAFLNRA